MLKVVPKDKLRMAVPMNHINGYSIRQSGFSYIWVLFIVALMGLCLSVAVEIDSTYILRDKEKELLAIGHQFRNAIKGYHESKPPSGKSNYPETLDELLKDDRFPGVKRHLRKLFFDPITGKSEWGVVRLGGRIVGIYSLSDKVPIKQDGFAPEDSNFRGKQKYSEWVFSYPEDLLMHADAGVASGVAREEIK